MPWRKIPPCKASHPMWRTPARGDGPSRKPLNWAYPPSRSRHPETSDFGREIPTRSWISCSLPCATNSAGTKSRKSNRLRGRILRLGGNFSLVAADGSAVVRLEFTEHDGRDDGQEPKNSQREMDAVDHFRRPGARLIGKEQGGGQGR